MGMNRLHSARPWKSVGWREKSGRRKKEDFKRALLSSAGTWSRIYTAKQRNFTISLLLRAILEKGSGHAQQSDAPELPVLFTIPIGVRGEDEQCCAMRSTTEPHQNPNGGRDRPSS